MPDYIQELREIFPELFELDERPPDPVLPKLTVKLKSGIMGKLKQNG